MVGKLFRPLAVAAVACALAAAARAQVGCGDPFQNHYGPFDYRTAPADVKDRVERFHFTPDVATLRKGATSMHIGADLNYTLSVFPNHPQALLAMAELARREKTTKPKGSEYDLDCWFERALTFRPDDGNIRLAMGVALLRDGKTKRAIEQLQLAEKALPESANVQYNLGLAYLEAKDYERSREHAKKAYELGFPLPGLRQRLERAGQWR